MRIVAVINQKGGVGKTTTAVNLGAALALRGRKVLLVDLDPQGNLTDHLGLAADEPEKDERPSSYGVLMGDVPLASAVLATRTPGLWVLPSTPDLAGVEIELAEAPGREARLKQALAALPAGAYDWVLVDCPPSLGLLSLNAMVAAREVFITLQTEYLSLKGLGQVTRTVDMVREMVNPELVISGIVATLVDPVTNLAREVIEDVRVTYGQRVFETRVRKNVRLAEAPSHGLHIFDYQPDSPGAADYKALAEEVEAWDPVAGRKAQQAARAPKPATTAKPAAAAAPARPAAASAPAKPAAPPPPAKPAAAAPPAKPAAASTPARPAAPAQPAARPAASAPPAAATKPPAPAPKPAAPRAPAAEAPSPAPAEAPRAPGGRFAPRTGATPAAKAPAPAAPAPKAAPAASAHPKAAPPKAVPSRAASPKAVPPQPASSAAPKPAGPAAPARPAAPAAPPKAPPPAPAAARPPTPPARPAVPSPGLRHERPWMKPPAK